MALPELERLVAVMRRLRRDCPWDARQTHSSLVPYLVEEACEVVEAIETGSTADLREELGDLLLQVIFHAEISAEDDGGFDVESVAAGIADKLVARHPHVFAADQVPADLHYTWEQRKVAEKGRTSVLQGIPEQLSALSRASKIIGRARSRRVQLPVPTGISDGEPVGTEEIGDRLLALVVWAQSQGIDAEQAARGAVRRLEAQVRDAEGSEPAAATHLPLR
jgi:XTP/dITP diphosphohydrolase